MKHSIFLGGTCGNNTWRDGLTARLVSRGIPAEALFNPIVKVWDEEAKRREDLVKRSAKCLLFYLGDPKMGANSRSFYSLFETMLALYDVPDRTVVVIDTAGMAKDVKDSMDLTLIELRHRFPHLPIFDSLDLAEDCIVDMFAPATA